MIQNLATIRKWQRKPWKGPSCGILRIMNCTRFLRTHTHLAEFIDSIFPFRLYHKHEFYGQVYKRLCMHFLVGFDEYVLTNVNEIYI